MSSEADFPEFRSMFERIVGGGDGFSRFFPVILALAAGEDVDDEESTDLTTRRREIVIDPLNPTVVMIRSATGLDDFLTGTGKQGRSPASKSSVESMPRVVIGEDKEKGGEGGSCAICLEEWSKGDVAAEMPCEHKFHSKCVEEWLGMHATCPLCRYEMPVDEEEEGKKVGVWIGFSINGGERRNEEDGEGRRAQSDGDSNMEDETEV
ncbi:E3 ubiquitin-protein ligase MPSR1 [Cardamine amara subsp. amara]|uniref:RING-type E3 ubiquitin transferase n=1 Tax=Cardamine amara subsp. amara TaxID=228776 RepID=A0ABD1A6Z2_CARAN